MEHILLPAMVIFLFEMIIFHFHMLYYNIKGKIRAMTTGNEVDFSQVSTVLVAVLIGF